MYLVTGVAGFIGSHVARRLLAEGYDVVGVDSLSDYYDPQLKTDRLALLQPHPNFTFRQADLSDEGQTRDLFRDFAVRIVIHLAAQPGVRHSLENPGAYVQSNLVGFLHVLEGCRSLGVQHLVFASSSSVYGANRKLPFATADNVDHPISLYAATKKSNELMAHVYSHLFRLPCTGLRFFTVYGPWGRPDMAPVLFARAIREGRPIDVYNYGKMRRDFTYIDDIVEGVVRAAHHVPVPDPTWDAANPDPSSSGVAPYRLYNIGNSQPVELMDFIGALEKALGVKADVRLKPIQPGDVEATFADVDDLQADVGFRPSTSLEEGVERFISWFRQYYTDAA